MNVLSLFDGMSCGQIALNRAGVKYENYFASEIDKNAIKVTQHNYPNTVQLGNVKKIEISSLPEIDLLIGGSPCQSFSFAGKRNGMSTQTGFEVTTLDQYCNLCDVEFEGESYLFWEYVRVFKQLKPKYFLLENVVMNKKWEKIISESLGVEPIFINSNAFSAQNRKRLYWTNLKVDLLDIPAQHFTIEDIFKDERMSVDRTKQITKQGYKEMILDFSKHCISKDRDTNRFFAKKDGTLAYKKSRSQLRVLEDKCNCLTTSGQSMSNSGSTNVPFITHQGELAIRALNRHECELAQTVPKGYTESVSSGTAIKMLGNGWTVDVIAQIFKSLVEKEKVSV